MAQLVSDATKKKIARKIARKLRDNSFIQLDGDKIKRHNPYEAMTRTQKAYRLNMAMGDLWRSGWNVAMDELRLKGVIGNKIGMKQASVLTSPVLARHLKEHMPTFMARAGITSADVNSQDFKDEWEMIADTKWVDRGFEGLYTGDMFSKFAKSPKPEGVRLESMNTQELLNAGYVRIPSFTRKDGTKVKSHVRKLR